jgi:hypothetical protein
MATRQGAVDGDVDPDPQKRAASRRQPGAALLGTTAEDGNRAQHWRGTEPGADGRQSWAQHWRARPDAADTANSGGQRRREKIRPGEIRPWRLTAQAGPTAGDAALAEDRRTRTTAPWQRAQAQEIPPWRRTGGPGRGRRPGSRRRRRRSALPAGWR